MRPFSRHSFGLSLLALSLVLAASIPAERPLAFLTKWGTYCDTGASGVDACDARFYGPYGVAAGPSGSVYVADTQNHRIQRFDSNGLYLGRWGGPGGDAGEFNNPLAVAADPWGYVWVADTQNHRIQKFFANGEVVRVVGWGVNDGTAESQVCVTSCQAGIAGAGDGQFDSPAGIAADASGNIYVSDVGNHRIQKFESHGIYQIQWGGPGTDAGQFAGPNGVAADSSGNVYVADRNNNRIQKFDGNGSFLKMWGWGVDDGVSELQVCTSSCQAGISGDGDGQLHYPAGIAVDASGTVYVADDWNARVQMFDGEGVFLGKWGSLGAGNLQFIHPVDVSVDASGSVFVADTLNHRIQKYGRALEAFVAATLPPRIGPD
jgi:sugar lactone lactonase YvrE